MNNREIELGYMSIEGGVWEGGPEDDGYDSDIPIGRKPPLDPNEIIINKQDITIIYTFCLAGECFFYLDEERRYSYHTLNPAGFTREDVSMLIMNQHLAEGEGKFTVRGLYLHTLYINEDGTYSPGIDYD